MRGSSQSLGEAYKAENQLKISSDSIYKKVAADLEKSQPKSRSNEVVLSDIEAFELMHRQDGINPCTGRREYDATL